MNERKLERRAFRKKARSYGRRNRKLNLTAAVAAVKASLEANGIWFEREYVCSKNPTKKLPTGLLFIADFRLKDGVLLEVDGGYHSTPEQKAKDSWRDRLLTSATFRGGQRFHRVVRITNEQALAPDFDVRKYLDAEPPVL